MSNVDEKALHDIIGGIASAAERDMKENSVVYRELKADANSSFMDIFQYYDLAATDVVLSVVAVIKEKYSIKRIDDELFEFIRDFPSNLHRLSKEIEEKEGWVCCVDKAWSRLAAQFSDLLKDNKERL